MTDTYHSICQFVPVALSGLSVRGHKFHNAGRYLSSQIPEHKFSQFRLHDADSKTPDKLYWKHTHLLHICEFKANMK